MSTLSNPLSSDSSRPIEGISSVDNQTPIVEAKITSLSHVGTDARAATMKGLKKTPDSHSESSVEEKLQESSSNISKALAADKNPVSTAPAIKKNIAKTQSSSLKDYVKSFIASLKAALESQTTKDIRENMPGVLEEVQKAGIDITDKKFRETVKKTLTQGAKSIGKGEMAVTHLANRKIEVYLQKEQDPLNSKAYKLNVYIKKRELGSGAFGTVIDTQHVKTGKSVALKISHASMDKEADEITKLEGSLYNEVEILKILNQNGPQEGIQEMVLLSELKTDGAAKQKVLTGKLYSRGDLKKPVAALRLQQLYGADEISNKTLHKLSRDTTFLVNNLNSSLKNKLKERRSLTSNESLDRASKQAKIAEIEKAIDKEIATFVNSLSAYDFLGEDEAKKLQRRCEAFVSNIQNDNFENEAQEEKALNDLCTVLREKTFEVAKQCRKIAPIDLNTRMALAGNVVTGLATMHENQIVHGDIKPENFFWDGTKAVIADFGGAQHVLGKHPELAYTEGYAPGQYVLAMRDYNQRVLDTRKQIQEAKAKGQNELAQRLEEQANKQQDNWFRVGRALDQRAMGVSLYQTLTGGLIVKDAKDEGFYADATYEEMKENMKMKGVPEKTAEIIARMSKPIKMESDKNGVLQLPETFSVPLTNTELKELAALLKT